MGCYGKTGRFTPEDALGLLLGALGTFGLWFLQDFQEARLMFLFAVPILVLIDLLGLSAKDDVGAPGVLN